MRRHGGLVNAYYWVKEVNLKYIVYGSNYMTSGKGKTVETVRSVVASVQGERVK